MARLSPSRMRDPAAVLLQIAGHAAVDPRTARRVVVAKKRSRTADVMRRIADACRHLGYLDDARRIEGEIACM